MIRCLSVGVLVATVCALQTGCCCCRMPFMAGKFNGPVPPPVVQVNPPQDKPPPKDKDQLKDMDQPKDKAGGAGKIYTYSQSTGQLKLGTELVGTGFSGKFAGKNNPNLEKQGNTGPMPAGDYQMWGRARDPVTGTTVIELRPFEGNDMFGRLYETRRWIHNDADPDPPAAITIMMPKGTVDRIDAPERPPKSILRVVR